MLADVPRVLRGILSKFAFDCTLRIKLVACAASEHDDYAVESEVGLASIHFLCWSLKEHGVQFWNKSRHQQLQERVYEMAELERSNFVRFREF